MLNVFYPVHDLFLLLLFKEDASNALPYLMTFAKKDFNAGKYF